MSGYRDLSTLIEETTDHKSEKYTKPKTPLSLKLVKTHKRSNFSSDSAEIILDSASLDVEIKDGKADSPRDPELAERKEYKRLITETEHVPDDIEPQHPPIIRVFKNKTVRRNWKTFLASFLLTLVGLILILACLVVSGLMGFRIEAIIMLVGGILLLLPGAYHFIYVCCAAHGVKGFKFSKLPTFR